MRIGIDLRWLHQALSQQPLDHCTGGIGAYSFSLVSNLLRIDCENQYVLFGSQSWRRELLEKYFPTDNRAALVLLPPSPDISMARAAIGRLIDFIYQQSVVADLVRRQRLDLMHFQEQGAVILNGSFKKVVTVMDLIPSVYPGHLFTSGLTRRVWQWQVSRLNKTDRIIAISNSTRDDIIKYANVPPHRVEVIHLGVPEYLPKPARNSVDDKQVCAALSVREPYFLYVGGLQFNKNVPGLIDAFAELAGGDPAVRLVMAGEARYWPDELRDLEQRIQGHGLQQRVHRTGWLSSGQLAALYRGAVALVHPAFYEGFGLTVLEAMSQGCPVIAANASSLPEVAGDAAVLVAPGDTAALAAAMRELRTKAALRQRLKKAGLDRAGTFSWRGHARRTLELYHRTINER